MPIETVVRGTRRELPYEDVWAMFGEGRHPHIEKLYETRLAPFLTQTSHTFWKTRLHYFRTGLYYQGGMVRFERAHPSTAPTQRHRRGSSGALTPKQCAAAAEACTSLSFCAKRVLFVFLLQGQVVWMFQILAKLLGLGAAVQRVATAPTLEEQRAAWEAAWPVRLLRSGPAWLVNALVGLVSLLFFNRFVLWCASPLSVPFPGVCLMPGILNLCRAVFRGFILLTEWQGIPELSSTRCANSAPWVMHAGSAAACHASSTGW